MEAFPRYWPFVRGIHRSPVNSPHKGQWRGALMFLWSASWINGWANNRETHYDVIVMRPVRCVLPMISLQSHQISRTTAKKISKLPIVDSVWGETTGGFPHRVLMRKACPSPDVIDPTWHVTPPTAPRHIQMSALLQIVTHSTHTRTHGWCSIRYQR